MPIKVVVTGSYRDQEQREWQFLPGQQERFEQIARAIGRKLAEQKYILLIAWSQANPESQFDTRRSNEQNHPYWQTADYHALEGYLETIRQSPELIEGGARIELKISEWRSQSIPCNPFGRSLDEYIEMSGVYVNTNTPHEKPEKRSVMLMKLTSEADVFMIIGGGKATKLGLAEATKRKIFLPLGFVGGIGKDAIADLSIDIKEKLIAEVGDLDNLRNVDTIIAKLPTLINIITSQSISPTQSPQEQPIMPSFPPTPNNENNEPPAPSTQRQSPNNFWSFLDNSRTEHPVIFWILVVGIIIPIVYAGISLFSGGKVEVTPGGGIKPVQPSPTTSASPPLSETKNTDNFQVTVNYRCLWKSQGKNSQPVDKATVKTFINGQLNSSDDTNSNGYVSFKMTSTDEIKAEITHLDARDVPIKDDVKLTPIELESKKMTIDRQSCLLFAKDKVKR
jgi:hypothetical protein